MAAINEAHVVDPDPSFADSSANARAMPSRAALLAEYKDEPGSALCASQDDVLGAAKPGVTDSLDVDLRNDELAAAK